MTTAAAKFWRDQAGAASVEYGLMAALIAAAISVTVGAIGLHVNTLFSVLNHALLIAGP